MGPQCVVAVRGWGCSEQCGCLWVGGIIGLLSEGSLEGAVGDGGLAGTSILATPEASELRGLYCVTQHGELEEVSTGEDCCGECRGESENLASPFEDLLSRTSNWRGVGGTNWLVYVSQGMRALCRT